MLLLIARVYSVVASEEESKATKLLAILDHPEVGISEILIEDNLE